MLSLVHGTLLYFVSFFLYVPIWQYNVYDKWNGNISVWKIKLRSPQLCIKVTACACILSFWAMVSIHSRCKTRQTIVSDRDCTPTPVVDKKLLLYISFYFGYSIYASGYRMWQNTSIVYSLLRQLFNIDWAEYFRFGNRWQTKCALK